MLLSVLSKERPQERRRSLDECTPPHKDVLFHVPPEEVDSVVEDSAYTESDWETLVQSMWFWGYMNRGDCEVKLYNEGKMGDFVVRINSNEQLAMSLWYVCTLFLFVLSLSIMVTHR